jgi:hypothetical protein
MLLHEEGHIRKGSSLTAALPALPVRLCLAFGGGGGGRRARGGRPSAGGTR